MIPPRLFLTAALFGLLATHLPAQEAAPGGRPREETQILRSIHRQLEEMREQQLELNDRVRRLEEGERSPGESEWKVIHERNPESVRQQDEIRQLEEKLVALRRKFTDEFPAIRELRMRLEKARARLAAFPEFVPQRIEERGAPAASRSNVDWRRRGAELDRREEELARRHAELEHQQVALREHLEHERSRMQEELARARRQLEEETARRHEQLERMHCEMEEETVRRREELVRARHALEEEAAGRHEEMEEARRRLEEEAARRHEEIERELEEHRRRCEIELQRRHEELEAEYRGRAEEMQHERIRALQELEGARVRFEVERARRPSAGEQQDPRRPWQRPEAGRQGNVDAQELAPRYRKLRQACEAQQVKIERLMKERQMLLQKIEERSRDAAPDGRRLEKAAETREATRVRREAFEKRVAALTARSDELGKKVAGLERKGDLEAARNLRSDLDRLRAQVAELQQVIQELELRP